MQVKVVQTTPFEGQRPGTSGLRKRVKVALNGLYLDNFVQATFTALDDLYGHDKVKGSTLVVGGDGRYGNDVVIQKIIKMAAAHGFGRLVIGQNGIFSTPAVSCIIRKRSAFGGIVLTASHNPGGPDGDFGIKYNVDNGGPAPSSVTNAIYEASQQVTQLRYAIIDDVDLSTCATVAINDDFTVEVVNSADAYVHMLRSLFNFDALRALLSRSDFRLCFDAMHGVTGAYVGRIFGVELGAKQPQHCWYNDTPLPDFGGGHPDPNLVYASELVDKCASGDYDMGVASDGDGDRNMILGKRFFVNPSDSIAVIAANAHMLPYLAESGLKGVARSMPTSMALDRVADQLQVPLYEVPTGWKYFGNLMDANQLSLCGEESFGTGSDHIREKDGIWAALCWLSILSGYNNTVKSGEGGDGDGDGGGDFVSIESIVQMHWKRFGRNYFTRYDFEECDAKGANAMIDHLTDFISSSKSGTELYEGIVLQSADSFTYTDPIDGSVATNQGLRFFITDGSRFIFRLSGTGSTGATIRLYVEKYDATIIDMETADAVKSLVCAAMMVSKLTHFTGRTEPTVIT